MMDQSGCTKSLRTAVLSRRRLTLEPHLCIWNDQHSDATVFTLYKHLMVPAFAALLKTQVAGNQIIVPYLKSEHGPVLVIK